MPRFPRVPTFWPSESKLPLSYPTPTSKAREKRPGDEVDPTSGSLRREGYERTLGTLLGEEEVLGLLQRINS